MGAFPVHVETVLLEHSDERLAAVEEAKRTGKPFVSVGSRGAEVVPVPVVEEIMDEFSRKDTYVGRFGATYAAHLESYHEKVQDPDWVLETNEEKARAHEQYSAELVRRQMEDEKKVKEMLVVDPTAASVAVQQANLERAREHEVKSMEYAEVIQQRAKDVRPVLAVVDESVRALRAEELNTASPREDRAAALAEIVEVPNAMENETREALVTKDKIIETEIPYEAEAAGHDELVHRDRPGIEIAAEHGFDPESLREATGLAQAYADNRTEEAVEAEAEVAEIVAEHEGEEVTTEPYRVLREAEESVPGGRDEADEMPETPSE